MTIKELKSLCESEIKRGNGDRKIWLSNDDEGNGYHELYYQFLTNPKDIKLCFESASMDCDEPEAVVILG